MFSTVLVFLLAAILQSTSQQPFPFIEVFVDQQASSTPEQPTKQPGTKSNPFTSLNDALTYAQQAWNTDFIKRGSFLPISIKVAPSDNPYQVSSFSLKPLPPPTSSQKKPDFFSISAWKEGQLCKSLATCPEEVILDFSESTFEIQYFKNFNLSNLSIISQDGSISLKNTNLIVKDAKFGFPSNLTIPSFLVSDAEKIVLQGITVNLNSAESLIKSTNSEKGFLVDVDFQNITVNATARQEEEDPQELFSFIAEMNSSKANLKLKGLNINIHEGRFVNTTLFHIKKFNRVIFQNLKISEQTLLMTNQLFKIENTDSVEVNNFSVTKNRILNEDFSFFSINSVNKISIINLDFLSNSLQIPSKTSFLFFNLLHIYNLNVTNLAIKNNLFNADTCVLFFPSPSPSTSSSMSFSANHITISNNTSPDLITAFAFICSQGSNLKSFTVTDFTFLKNQLTGRIFSLEDVELPNKTTSTQLNFRKINFLGNQNVHDIRFFVFSFLEDYSTDEYVLSVEPFRVYFNDSIITENSFSKAQSKLWKNEGSFFLLKQTQLYLSRLTLANNTLQSYNLIRLDHKPSSVFITESVLKNNTFNASRLVSTNYPKEYSYNGEDKSIDETTPLYRYCFILNSNFINLRVISSELLQLNNNHMLFLNNAMQNISFTKSSFLTSNFYSTESELPEIEEKRSPKLESLTLDSNLRKFFNKVMTQSSSKQQSELLPKSEKIYFACILNNTFQKITLQDMKKSFISIKEYDGNQSFILVNNNRFNNLNLKQKNSLPIFEFNDLSYLTVSENSFQGVIGNIILFSIPESSPTNLLEVISNNISSSQTAAFFDFSSTSIINLNITKNRFNIAHFGFSCISVKVITAIGDWNLVQNKFSKVFLDLNIDRRHPEQNGLISLFADNSTNSSRMRFRENEFFFVILNKIGFADSSATITGLIIRTPQKVLLEKNVWDGFWNTVGGLIQTINLVSFSMADNDINSIFLGSSGGVLTLSTKTAWIQRNTFETINAVQSSGIIYIKTFLKNHEIWIEDNSFLDVNETQKGSILTIKPREEKFNSSQILQSLVDLKLHFLNSTIRSSQSAKLIDLEWTWCNDCVFKGGSIDAFNELGSLIELVRGIAGRVIIEDIKLNVSCLGNFQFVQVNSFYGELIFKNIAYKGLMDFTLLKADSGNISIHDSVFQNIILGQSAFLGLISSEKSDRNSLEISPPTLSLRNVSFEDFSAQRLEEIKQQIDDIRGTLDKKIPGTLPTIQKVPGLLNFIYDPTSSSNALPTSAVILMTQAGRIFIENCTFKQILSLPSILSTGSTKMIFEKPSLISIQDSSFIQNEFVFGSAVNILSKSLVKSLEIINCTFANNSAFFGSSISVYEALITIKDSTFSHNKAISAPAVYIGRSATYKEKIGNHNLFLSNDAYYKENLNHEAVDFNVTFVSHSPGTNTSIFIQVGDGDFRKPNISDIELQLGVLKIDFIDKQGNSVPAFLQQMKTELFLPENSKQNIEDRFFRGITQVEFHTFNISLNSLRLGGKAGQEVTIELRFTSDFMEKQKKLQFLVRPCVAGEFNNSGACQLCVKPNYSVDPNQNCTKCPDHAECPGQSKIIPHAGYWNANPQSEQIYRCRRDQLQRCKNTDNLKRSCEVGYTGPLCEACDFENSYIESGYLKCGKCTDPTKSLMVSVFLGVCYLFYQTFSVFALYESNTKISSGNKDYLFMRKIERSYYIKALLSYTQIMSNLYIDSSQVYKHLGMISQIGNPTSLILYGTQCSLVALGIDYQNFLSYQIFFVVFSPYAQLLGIIIILIILKKVRPSLPLKKVIAVAAVYSMISYQPGMVTTLIQFLSCTSLKGLEYDYIAAHPSWICDSNYHAIATYIAFPSLILWCGIMPVGILVYFLINKKSLRKEEEEGTTAFGMLIFDFKEKFFYWGIVFMGVKLALSFLVYGTEKSKETYIFMSLILLWFYQSSMKIFKPYSRKSFNKFEIMAMNLLMFNIIVTRFFLDLENDAGSLSMIVSVVLNGGFLMIGIWKVLSLTLLNVIAKIEKNLMGRRITKSPSLLGDSYSDLQL